MIFTYQKCCLIYPSTTHRTNGPTTATPPGPIRGLSAASQRARALSGYNHTLQGIIDIGTWMDGLSLHRPEQLLLFQPLLVNEVKTLRVGSEFESKYSRAHQFHSLRKWKRLNRVYFRRAWSASRLERGLTILTPRTRMHSYPAFGKG